MSLVESSTGAVAPRLPGVVVDVELYPLGGLAREVAVPTRGPHEGTVAPGGLGGLLAHRLALRARPLRREGACGRHRRAARSSSRPQACDPRSIIAAPRPLPYPSGRSTSFAVDRRMDGSGVPQRHGKARSPYRQPWFPSNASLTTVPALTGTGVAVDAAGTVTAVRLAGTTTGTEDGTWPPDGGRARRGRGGGGGHRGPFGRDDDRNGGRDLAAAAEVGAAGAVAAGTAARLAGTTTGTGGRDLAAAADVGAAGAVAAGTAARLAGTTTGTGLTGPGRGGGRRRGRGGGGGRPARLAGTTTETDVGAAAASSLVARAS